MATAQAPAGAAPDLVIIVHVLEARGLAQPRPTLSAHASVHLGRATAHTHNARVRAGGSVRWEAGLSVAAPAECDAPLTVCVVTGGREPLLLGQLTLPSTCVLLALRALRTWSCADTPRGWFAGRGAPPSSQRAQPGTRCTTGTRTAAPAVRVALPRPRAATQRPPDRSAPPLRRRAAPCGVAPVRQ